MKKKMFKNMSENIPGRGMGVFRVGVFLIPVSFCFCFLSFKVSWLFACFYPENSSFSSNFWTLCLLFSLVFSILFYIYLLLKSRFHFFFGSNLKKILWECNYLEVLCRIIVIPKLAMCLKKLCKRVYKLFSNKKN